jgi:hypothetical protein
MFPAQDLEFSFIDFFQWDRYDFLAMGSVHCVVTKWKGGREHLGQEAIVENRKVDFFRKGRAKITKKRMSAEKARAMRALAKTMKT